MFCPFLSAKKDAMIVIYRRWDSTSATRRSHFMNSLRPFTILSRIFAIKCISLKCWKPSLAQIDPKKQVFGMYPGPNSLQALKRAQSSSVCQSCPRSHRVPCIYRIEKGAEHIRTYPRKRTHPRNQTARQKSCGWINSTKTEIGCPGVQAWDTAGTREHIDKSNKYFM